MKRSELLFKVISLGSLSGSVQPFWFFFVFVPHPLNPEWSLDEPRSTSVNVMMDPTII